MPSNPQKQKLYCYLDETGQDTLGKFFIVSVIVTGSLREELIAKLEEIEKASHKGKTKWNGARPSERLEYITAVLSDPLFKGTLRFAMYQNTKTYTALTIISAARAIHSVPEYSSVAVYVDGLPRTRILWFGTELRRLQVRLSKIVSVRREESNALIRLADACCGFVRQALVKGDPAMKDLFDRACRTGFLKEV